MEPAAYKDASDVRQYEEDYAYDDRDNLATKTDLCQNIANGFHHTITAEM